MKEAIIACLRAHDSVAPFICPASAPEIGVQVLAGRVHIVVPRPAAITDRAAARRMALSIRAAVQGLLIAADDGFVSLRHSATAFVTAPGGWGVRLVFRVQPALIIDKGGSCG